MAHLKDYLDRFARRELAMADLKRECLRIAGGDGPLSAALRGELDAAREAGVLKPSEYEGLEYALAAALLAGSNVAAMSKESDPETTSGAGNDEETVIRPFKPREQGDYSEDVTVMRPAQVSAADDGASDSRDDDATVVRPSAAPHVPATPELSVPDPDEEPTEFRNDEGDRTVGGADADDESEDKTVMVGADDYENAARAAAAGADDGDRTVVASGDVDHAEDATQMVGSHSSDDGDDATTLNPGMEDDRTTVNADIADRTRVMGADESDVFGDDTSDPIDITNGDATWDPTTTRAARPLIDRVFESGSILKDRFRLTDALGEGGMGTVWRAVDILKVEAEDRNPYVAIKLLQGDFKTHPESFIALQRESSKQQRLAHPNIATVFDFDREAESGTVYMTMEVMKGQDLADFVKTIPEGGLDYEPAMEIIEQLGAGLAYAHKAGLVHSDLKPGNCFLTDENRVKLLDFGIARASATRDDAEGEKTKFDPGTLGALTPSYATVEMFQGLEPDPRDDIYAMAIIAHQMFTGKHPFNRRSAPKAMKEGLTVQSLDKLTKRQNRILAEGLAFEREHRTGSVEEFLEGLRPRKTNLALTVGMPVALTVALVLGLWNPVNTFLDEKEREAILVDLKLGDIASIDAVLNRANELDDPDQLVQIQSDDRMIEAIVALITKGGEQGIRSGLDIVGRLLPEPGVSVKSDQRSVASVVGFYRQRMLALFDPQKGKFDFSAAYEQFERLRDDYPNQADTFAVRDALLQLRTDAGAAQGVRLEQLLTDNKLLPVEGQDDVGDVLDVVRQMVGSQESVELSAILTSPSISTRYVQAANLAIDAKDYAGAERVLGAGLRYAPNDPALANLSRDVLAELKRRRDAKRATEIEIALAPVWPEFASLGDFEGARADLLELSQLNSRSEILVGIRGQFKTLFDAGYQRLISDGNWEQARALLVRYAPLLELEAVRSGVSFLEDGAGKAGVKLTPIKAGELEQRTDYIAKLLGNPEFTNSWDSVLDIAFKELAAALPSSDTQISEIRAQIVQRYAEHADVVIARDDYEQAFTSVNKAKDFDPKWSEYETRAASINKARGVYLARKAEEERLARLEALKTTLIERAQAGEPDAAKEALAELREGLPSDDQFLIEEAPKAIAQSYYKLAVALASSEEYESALRLVDGGLAVAPKNLDLKNVRAEYLIVLRQRAVSAQVGSPRLARGPSPRLAVELSAGGSASLSAGSKRGIRSRSAPATHASSPVPPAQRAWQAVLDAPPGQASVISAPSAPALQSEMARAVARAMVGQLDTRPQAIATLSGPIATYGELFPDGRVEFERQIGQAVVAGLEAAAKDLGTDPATLVTPLVDFNLLFPALHKEVLDRIGQLAGNTLVERVRAQPQDVAAAAQLLRAYGDAFASKAQGVRTSVVALIADGFGDRAGAANGDATTLGASLRALRASLGADAAAIELRTATALARSIADASKANPTDVVSISPRVRAFTEHLPAHVPLLVERLVPGITAGLTTLVETSAENVGALAEPLGQLRALLPAAGEEVAVRLGPVAVEGLAVLVESQPLSEFMQTTSDVLRLFSGQLAAASSRLTPLLADRLVDLAKLGDIGALSASMVTVADVLPDSSRVLRQRVIPVAVDVLATRAGREDIVVTDLREPINQLSRDFPDSKPLAARKLAPVLVDSLVRMTRASGLGFDDLGASLLAFKTVFPGQVAQMERRVIDASTEVLAAAARDAALDSLAQATGRVLELFSSAGDSVAGRIGPLVTDRLVALARAGDIGALAQPTETFGRLLPSAVQNMHGRLIPAAVDALVARAGRTEVSLADLSKPTETLRRVFPDSTTQLERKLAPVLIGRLVLLAQTAGTDVTSISEPLRSFRSLFSGQSQEMERRVAESLVESITGAAAANPSDVASLVVPLREFRALLPAQANSIDEPLGNVLANGLRAKVTGDPKQLVGLGGSIGGFRIMLPDRAVELDRIVGAAALDAIERDTRADSGKLDTAAARVEAFATLFPSRLDDARARLAPLVSESIVDAARARGTDLAGATELVKAFSVTFPGQASALRSDVAQVLWRAIEMKAEKQPGQLKPIANLLREYQVAFAQDYEALSGALASRTARGIRSSARDTKVSLVEVASMLEQFRSLFPSQHKAVAEDVGGALVERLAGAKVDSTKRIRSLGPALREVRSLFPQKHAGLQRQLGDKVAKRVESMIGSDPFKANDIHVAALEVFPSNAALNAIRIELPLPEVRDGVTALDRGLLTKARKFLDASLAKNAQHSTIPKFRKALEAREARGLAAYSSYRKIVKTSRRASDRTKALNKALTLWRDNAKFVEIRPPAPNACIANKAGLGKRVPCYDKVGKRRSEIGPVLVVVPAGDGIEAPFAISKYEVSVTDWNRYCSATKECKRSRLKRALPMHKVSVAQIEKYLTWLSKVAKITYRLPTTIEWEYAANAAGVQPKRDFNCTVTVGNQQLKGLSLTSYKSGLPNGWGLVNYVGNVREFVRDGSAISARGGSLKNRLQECAVGLTESHDGRADAITGFRVVRAISER